MQTAADYRDLLVVQDGEIAMKNTSDKPKYSIQGYLAGSSPVEGYDDESVADTLKEARERAKAMMTDEHARIVESTVPIVYVQVRPYGTDIVLLEFGQPSGRTER